MAMNNVVTVAGANGQLGRRIALALARSGAAVRALVRGSPSDRAYEMLRRAGEVA
jgi:NAD(P)-dependent dehydrogenase (short-subunit alcohol dehydrogenase family)